MNKSAVRTLEVLRLIADSQEALTVSQIAKQLDMPKTSTFDILTALVHMDFVRVEDPRLKTYRLGLGAFQTGMAFLGQADLYSVAHDRLQELSAATGHTVYLAVEDRGRIVYLDKQEQDSPIRFSMDPGSQNALYRTGLGKALLAAEPELLEKLPLLLERRTAATLVTREALFADLEVTRKRGYALDLGEDNELLRCVAVPVRSADGKAVAAISVSMLVSDFEKKDLAVLAALLTRAALDISRRLGYRETVLYKT